MHVFVFDQLDEESVSGSLPGDEGIGLSASQATIKAGSTELASSESTEDAALLGQQNTPDGVTVLVSGAKGPVCQIYKLLLFLPTYILVCKG